MPITEPDTLATSSPTSLPSKILVSDVTDADPGAAAFAGVYTYNSGNGRWEKGAQFAEKGAGVETYEFSDASDVQFVAGSPDMRLLGDYDADGDFTGTMKVTADEPQTFAQA